MNDEIIIFNCAVKILLALNKAGYLIYESIEDYFEYIGKVLTIPYAYMRRTHNLEDEKHFYKTWYPEEIPTKDVFLSFQDDVMRVRYIFDNYNHNNEVMWTVLAYVWENRFGDGALSYYERDCMNDDYYIEIGRVLKDNLCNYA